MVVPTPTSWSLSLSVSDTALNRTSWRSMLGDERYVLRPASRLGSDEQYSGRVKRGLIRSLPEGRRSKRVGNAQAKGCHCPLARLGGVHRRRSSILGELGSPCCNSIKPSGGLGQQSSRGQLRTWHPHTSPPGQPDKDRERVRVQRGISFMFLAESCGYEPRATSQSAVGGKGWSW